DARTGPGPRDRKARRGGRRARRCAAAITRRASAASSARASMAGGVTCSGKALVSQCAPEAPIGVTFRQKALRYQRTAQSVLNRGGKALSRRRDPDTTLNRIRCPAFTRVFPKNRCERAASGISPGTKNFFAKTSFTQRLPPFGGQKPFLDRFLGEGA